MEKNQMGGGLHFPNSPHRCHRVARAAQVPTRDCIHGASWILSTPN